MADFTVYISQNSKGKWTARSYSIKPRESSDHVWSAEDCETPEQALADIGRGIKRWLGQPNQTTIEDELREKQDNIIGVKEGDWTPEQIEQVRQNLASPIKPSSRVTHDVIVTDEMRRRMARMMPTPPEEFRHLMGQYADQITSNGPIGTPPSVEDIPAIDVQTFAAPDDAGERFDEALKQIDREQEEHPPAKMEPWGDGSITTHFGKYVNGVVLITIGPFREPEPNESTADYNMAKAKYRSSAAAEIKRRQQS